MFKVLIVDDEQDVEPLFVQKFRKELREGKLGFYFAFNGADALAKLRATKPPDVMLVLSDINMPNMTGLELLQTICTEFPSLKVIMVTAYGDDYNFNTAKKYGAYNLMTKPVDFNALKETFEKLNNELSE